MLQSTGCRAPGRPRRRAARHARALLRAQRATRERYLALGVFIAADVRAACLSPRTCVRRVHRRRRARGVFIAADVRSRARRRLRT